MIVRKNESNRPLSRTGKALAASLLIAFFTASGSAVAQADLPSLGDGLELSVGDERRIGDDIIRQLYRDPDYLDDGPLQEYVQATLDALRQAARTRGELPEELDERFAWTVLLGRDRSVNAFALPGGYLGVHLGLVGVVSSRDELASVLAHELSHVSQRHIARLFAQQQRMTPLMIGTMLLGALAASKSPHAAEALMVGGQAAAIQSQLNFSRDMEREADRLGFALMAPGGFAPQGFVTMFDKLQQANRLNDNGNWPYLRSHPLTTARIADMQARLPTQTRASEPSPTLEHALLAARARVLARPGVDVLRQWSALPHSSGFATQPLHQRVAAWYAAALAHMQLRDGPAVQRALQALQTTLQQEGRSDAAALRQVRLLAAQWALQAEQPAQALQQLDAASRGRPELLLRSQALLRLGQAAQASGPLELWLSQHPQDASAWQLLAQAWQQQGQVLRSVRAEAEARAAHYDWAAAIDRLRAGQALARSQPHVAQDHIEASIIDTRLRVFESRFREQAAQR